MKCMNVDKIIIYFFLFVCFGNLKMNFVDNIFLINIFFDRFVWKVYLDDF